jgi:hypothetical protein
MKKTVFYFSLLLTSLGAQSQTNVSGNITSNTTWTLAGSPYLVTDDLIVDWNVQLNIEPGVTVKFDVGTELEMRGILSAVGTAEAPIVFTSNAISPAMGNWKGIRVIGSQAEPLMEDQVFMKHCKGLYADKFIDLNIAYNGPYVFRNCEFTYNNRVNFDGGIPLTWFDSCHFENNYDALTICQFESRVSHSNFINNVNGVYAIHLVDSCYFSGHTGIALSPYGITTGCTLKNNAVAVSGLFNAVNHTFVNNIVMDNQVGIQLFSFFDETFTGNTICNNTLYNVQLSTNHNADLSGNCWCLTDSAAIQDKIYDSHNDSSLGTISFMPTASDCPQNTLNIDAPATALMTTVLPNPFGHQLTVQLEAGEEAVLTLCDISGRQILQQQFVKNLTIDTAPFNDGMYFYTLQTASGLSTSGKVLKGGAQ